MYDVLVVGARCAGAATAMQCAQRGLDVLLVDQASFPSERPQGHFIHRHGPERLQRWGLLDRVLATGCPAITSIVSDPGDFALVGEGLEVDGVPVGLGPRRGALDKVLVDAAVEAGAELRERFAVRELTFADGRVTGVRTAEGHTEHARVVVGADGRGSRVARDVSAPAYEDQPTVTCWYVSYWADVPGEGLELYSRDGRVLFAFPTNDALFALFVSFPIAELAAVRADPEGAVLSAADRVPELSARIRSGTRVEPLYGAAALPNFVRRPWGEGWALVGDAGCHKDPYLALGVCDAFRDAELLADALASGRPLAEYERSRNEATLEDFHLNLMLARTAGAPPPELLAARAGMRGDAEATRQFFLQMEGRLTA